jgi:hypothetical protein
MIWDIPATLSAVTELVSKFVPDRDLQIKIQNELAIKLAEIEAQQIASQAEINKAEAQSGNKFASSWRPLVGYICAVAFAWQFIGQPFFSFFYVMITHQPAPVVALQADALMSLLFGLLGISGMRSWEKIKGVTK